MLNIMLNGSEPPALVRVFASVLNFFAEQLTGLTADDYPFEAAPAAPAASAAPAEAPKASKSVAKRQKAQAETPPPADNAHVAEGCEPISEAPDVKIEDIRAIARKFNTDETREIAVAILAKHGAKSVTELAERDNTVRIAALNDFTAALG